MNTNNRSYWSWSTGSWRMSIFDGEAEEPVDDGSETEHPMQRWHTTVLNPCVEGDRVRMYVDTWNSDGAGISEIEVYGEPVELP